MTNAAAFNMSEIATKDVGSNMEADQELFYYNDQNGVEVLINLCDAPIKKDTTPPLKVLT